MNLIDALRQIESYGATDVVLPFFLIFAIVYGILIKINLFRKNSSTVVAIIFAATTVIFHVTGKYPRCWDVVTMINNSIPSVMLVIIGFVSLIIILGLIGVSINFFSAYFGWIAFASLVYIIYTFLNARGPGCRGFLFGGNLELFLTIMLPAALFILIIWFITRPQGGN